MRFGVWGLGFGVGERGKVRGRAGWGQTTASPVCVLFSFTFRKGKHVLAELP